MWDVDVSVSRRADGQAQVARTGEGRTIVCEPTNGQEQKSIFARLFAATHGAQNAERLL
jgi:hypothetical protein